MNISVIIPNYNGVAVLKKNLPKVLDSIKGYKKGKVEIVIPDDNSSDHSIEAIEDLRKMALKNDIVIKTVENKKEKEKGFSKNVNRGADMASGDILILLNTDVSPHKDFLEPLLKHFEDSDVFAVGCMDESVEKGNKILRGRGVGGFSRGFLVHRRGEVDKNNTLWVSGGSGAFRKEIWNKLEGLDPLYTPFYWEDIDLSYRALKSGYKIYFEPKSIVTHEHEEGIIKKRFKQSFIRKISYRNQFIFMWKNITELKLLTSHLFWLPYYFTKALVSGDTEFYEGFLLAFAKIPKVMQMRYLAKKYFVKSDTDVLRGLDI